jgi:hypothetical protein
LTDRGRWMADVYSALESMAADRRRDPLAPLTVIVPSHAAGLQLRRRLADVAPFAGVRFEMLARVAETLAAGTWLRPAARPGPADRRLRGRTGGAKSRGTLARVGELPGYARALRMIFRRMRRGSIRRAAEAAGQEGAQLAELLRLFDRFREATAKFYDTRTCWTKLHR